MNEPRYGVRRARLLDTGEVIKIATVEGELAGVLPEEDGVRAWAEEHGMEVVTKELMRELMSRG